MNTQETNEKTIGIYWINTNNEMSTSEPLKAKGFGKFQKKIKSVIDKLKIGYP